MALYSMHLRDGTEALFDPRAREFSDLDALRTAVLIAARDLLNRDAGNGMLDSRFRIDAEDEEGAIVYSLRLEHANYATTPTLKPDPIDELKTGTSTERASRPLKPQEPNESPELRPAAPAARST